MPGKGDEGRDSSALYILTCCTFPKITACFLSFSHCSFRSIFLQKKQECADNTASSVRQVINQLQKWSQTVQAEPSSSSQVKHTIGSIHLSINQFIKTQNINKYAHLYKKLLFCAFFYKSAQL